MNQILANHSTSITDLKRNPNILLEETGDEPIAILNHNTPVAYLVPSATYEALLEALEDTQLMEIIAARENEYHKAIEVNIDDL